LYSEPAVTHKCNGVSPIQVAGTGNSATVAESEAEVFDEPAFSSTNVKTNPIFKEEATTPSEQKEKVHDPEDVGYVGYIING
jgi:hypothetical protein